MNGKTKIFKIWFFAKMFTVLSSRFWGVGEGEKRGREQKEEIELRPQSIFPPKL